MNANVARTALRAATRSSTRRARAGAGAGAGAARSLSFAPTARPTLNKMLSATAKPWLARGLKTIEFTEGIPEKVYEREDWPLEKLQDYFKNETFAILGYGSQGHGQGLKLVLPPSHLAAFALLALLSRSRAHCCAQNGDCDRTAY